MALSNFNFGFDLGFGGLGLGLGTKLLSSSGVGSLKLKQRDGSGSRRRRRRLVELQLFHVSDKCLVWRRSSWGGSWHLKQAGCNGETALLGGSTLGQGRNFVTANGFGSENRSDKRSLEVGSNATIWGFLARLYFPHQTRIASSKSSSSSGSSPGVDAASENLGEDSKQYYDVNGKSSKFENQSNFFRKSDSFSGGWESEQDLSKAEYAERNNSSQDASTSSSEESFGEGNGKLLGKVVENAQEEDSWAREGTTSIEISSSSSSSSTTAGATSVGPKEPVYEVIEVLHSGRAVKKLVSRRQLLRTSGLRLRDLRRVDPSLWVTNSAPALLVRDQAILLNLGSLRAIATTQEVMIFDHKSKGARSFIGTLIPRLSDHQNSSVMPFELEVIESALISRTQRLEQALMDVEPGVLELLEVLPTCMTADLLEELRVSKQALVEIGSKAGALRQMLLELLEHPQDIRRMVIMGRICSLGKDGTSVECAVPEDKQVAEDEEEEMEMLLEYYLQRCESTHGQAMKLLSSAKEMEDSIAVNLSSRRLEVSRLELLLQVGTFCAALGALIAGIFGMNLKSYLEERVLAFWFTTGGIIFGGLALFIYMFNYLSSRKIV
ncbi:unnamed protein product [Calypogeia fissa]